MYKKRLLFKGILGIALVFIMMIFANTVFGIEKDGEFDATNCRYTSI